MRWFVLMAALGLTGCVKPVSEPGLCAGLRRPVADLRSGLELHPETAPEVGEPGTDVVLGFEAGCGTS